MSRHAATTKESDSDSDYTCAVKVELQSSGLMFSGNGGGVIEHKSATHWKIKGKNAKKNSFDRRTLVLLDINGAEVARYKSNRWVAVWRVDNQGVNV